MDKKKKKDLEINLAREKLKIFKVQQRGKAILNDYSRHQPQKMKS